MDLKSQKKLYQEIGKISMSFSSLESCIQILLWILIGSGQRIGKIITSEMSFNRLVHLLGSLAKERAGGNVDLDLIKDICKRAFELEQERNKVIHSAWGVDIRDNEEVLRTKVTAKFKKGLYHTFENLNLSYLAALSDKIIILSSEVNAMIVNILNSAEKNQ